MSSQTSKSVLLKKKFYEFLLGAGEAGAAVVSYKKLLEPYWKSRSK
jgi:hypothetical protein